MDPTIIRVTDIDPGADPDLVADALQTAAEMISRKMPERYADAVADQPEVAAWVRAVVNTAVRNRRGFVPVVRTGPSLLLLGGTGSGKTFQAYGAIRAIAASGAQCGWQVLTAADCYARLRSRHGVDSETEFERIADSRLLVVDDLGTARSTEWTEEINYRLVNHRYEHRLPTLITSNLLPRDLASTLGDRVASRLAEMTQRVVLTGNDRRRGGPDAH